MSETRFWKSPAEYEAQPEVERQREEEFAAPPQAYFEAQPQGGLDFGRRDFLKWSTAALAVASAACTRKPVQHLVPYAQQPEEVLPGKADYYASTCMECAAGCGLLVKTREGRPIKVEGNPLHPLNQGTACARGQATFLNLYDPDRMSGSLRFRRGRGAAAPLALAQADQELAQAFRAAGPQGVVLTGTITGPARQQLLADFSAAFGTRRVIYDAFNPDALRAGQAAAYGAAATPHFHFDQAEMLVTFGADPLGSGYSRVEYELGFGRLRKLRNPAAMSRVVAFEPAMSLTGMNADSRYLVRADELLEVALSLAHQLVLEDRRSVFATDATVKYALAAYAPAQVEPRAGLAAGTLAKLAGELWQNRGRSLVYATGLPLDPATAPALEVAAAFLNSVLENEGVTVDATASPSGQAQGSDADMLELLAEMRAGGVKALLVYGTNPAYTLPPAAGFAEALKQVPLVAVLSERLDETARMADLALAGLHAMECWGDAEPVQGVYSLAQPTVRPLFDGRGLEDTLIAIGRAAGAAPFQSVAPAAAAPAATPGVQPATPAAAATPGAQPATPAAKTTATAPGQPAATATAPAAPVNPPKPLNFHAYLKNYWQTKIYAANHLAGSFDDFWTSALRDGVFVPNPQLNAAGKPRNFKPAALTAAAAAAGAVNKSVPAEGALLLSLTVSPMLGDGARNNNGYLLEAPDPVAKICWDNFLSIAPATAQRLGLADNDLVEFEAQGKRVRVPLHVQPGVQAESATLALGWGRRAVGTIGNQVGVNAFPLARVEPAAKAFAAPEAARPAAAKGAKTAPAPAPAAAQALAFGGLRIRPRKVGQYFLAQPQGGNNYLLGRPIVQQTTLVQIKAHPHAGQKPEGPDENIWNNGQAPAGYQNVPQAGRATAQLYPGHHWGMTIDLNACTGCNACVVACYAENNVAVVGREQVQIGRDMAWLRIDRYYSGELENPDVVNEPMLCQQCANAPCESVCPVLATVTNDEGLNLQVYNRCVGTRFCSNNCPYKVRRFNFYGYIHDQYSFGRGTPLELALNPDVTVRARGVMEKCTFCVQRINAAHWEAQALGRPIQDGQIKTACQQTCPSQAIYFGDMNDANSKMMQARTPRGFRVLADLNTEPTITYLTKVRNAPASQEGA